MVAAAAAPAGFLSSTELEIPHTAHPSPLCHVKSGEGNIQNLRCHGANSVSEVILELAVLHCLEHMPQPWRESGGGFRVVLRAPAEFYSELHFVPESFSTWSLRDDPLCEHLSTSEQDLLSKA